MLGVRPNERAAAAKLCRSATSRNTRMRSICPVIRRSPFHFPSWPGKAVEDERSSERPMPGHPRGSACKRREGYADRARTIRETIQWLDDVDARDKPGHDAAGSQQSRWSLDGSIAKFAINNGKTGAYSEPPREAIS